uniref:Uncharacterized protein n=1 Tax=Rhizophora mucronata TaxID=61149 RepID=A0A2P2JL71_RHIMU
MSRIVSMALPASSLSPRNSKFHVGLVAFVFYCF